MALGVVRPAVLYSAALHVVLVALMVAGLPWFMSDPPEIEPTPIIVELAPVAERTNPQPPKVEPKPEPPKPEVAKAEPPRPEPPKPEPPKPEPPKPEVRPEPPKPEPPKPEARPEPPRPEPPQPDPKPEVAEVAPEPPPKPKEAPKQAAPPPTPKSRPVEAKKPPKPEPKATDQVAALLSRIKPNRSAAPPPAERNAAAEIEAPTPNPPSLTGEPLTMSEIDAIRAQIIANWFPPFGAKDAADMEVWIRISVNPDGTLYGRPQVVRGSQTDVEQFQPFVDSTVRAILKSQPLRVPAGKHQAFKDIEFRFNMKDMLRG